MKKRTPEAQQLESEYLALVRAALANRRFSDATEIIQSVQEHIDEALAESPGDEAAATEMANVLERLGPPATFAQEENPAEDEAIPRRANQEIGVPGNGAAAAAPARTSGLAATSVLALPVAIVIGFLVLAIAYMTRTQPFSEVLVLMAMLVPPAILLTGSILGVSALLVIRNAPGRLRGKGLAWVGALQFPFVCLVVIAFLSLRSSSPSPARAALVATPPASAPTAGANDISPLLVAAQTGRLDKVKQLLAKGVSVNAKDKAGMTPLLLAAQEGHLELVKWLLENGADVHAAGENGQTALYLAAWGGHSAVVEFLCDGRADVNAQDNAGFTPLHVAAAHGHLDSVKALVAKGADASIKDSAGHTPADVATINKHQDVADFLKAK